MSQKQSSKSPSSHSVKIRSRFEDHSAFSPVVETGEETQVKQSFKDECDINVIVERNKKTGMITHVRQGEPMFGDFAEISSYEESLQTVIAAENAFAELPAAIRDRFMNNPAEFVRFANDPSNQDAMVEMGLATYNENKKTAGTPPAVTSEPSPAPAPAKKEAPTS